MVDIVAVVLSGGMVTNDPETIKRALDAGSLREVIDRPTAEVMAFADLGAHWEALAKGRSLGVRVDPAIVSDAEKMMAKQTGRG